MIQLSAIYNVGRHKGFNVAYVIIEGGNPRLFGLHRCTNSSIPKCFTQASYSKHSFSTAILIWEEEIVLWVRRRPPISSRISPSDISVSQSFGPEDNAAKPAMRGLFTCDGDSFEQARFRPAPLAPPGDGVDGTLEAGLKMSATADPVRASGLELELLVWAALVGGVLGSTQMFDFQGYQRRGPRWQVECWI